MFLEYFFRDFFFIFKKRNHDGGLRKHLAANICKRAQACGAYDYLS